jgi:PIN domain nuclease of toxin-antitoxin system
MTSVVADTHSLIWYLLDDPRLSGPAGSAFDAATAANRKIYVPTICFVEATYLVEKKRISEQALSAMEQAVEADNSAFRAVDLSLDVAKRVREIPRNEVPDMPDRVIAGTALALGLALVSRDRKIRSSGIETIW